MTSIPKKDTEVQLFAHTSKARKCQLGTLASGYELCTRFERSNNGRREYIWACGNLSCRENLQCWLGEN